MNIQFAKNNLQNLPYSIGKLLSKIPYKYRPGLKDTYIRSSKNIQLIDNLKNDEIEDFIFNKVQNIACFAFENVDFYNDLYTKQSFNPHKMKCFRDIQEIPIVTKSLLQTFPLDGRSYRNKSKKYSLSNTGGSSGTPFEFYVNKEVSGNEWAHVHGFWQKFGYDSSSLKIYFGGRSGVVGPGKYDSLRHHFAININMDWQHVADYLLIIFSKYSPKFLHGYPSCIFDFLLWLDKTKHPLTCILKKHIKAVFLASEYPNPNLRKKISDIYPFTLVCFYGHTEGCVFAGEISEGVYKPYHSYGFAEAIEENNDFNLVGTNYFNYATPLIRYNTQDIIKPDYEMGLLNSFLIEKGRNGDFILDKDNHKIFLTGLVYGRHHDLFNYVSHVQVKQLKAGLASILYVSPDDNFNPAVLFDASNVKIKFDFIRLDKPILTAAGKLNLLIK